MKTFLMLCLSAWLVACSDQAPKDEIVRLERPRQAESGPQQAPKQQVYPMASGQLVLMGVPVADPDGDWIRHCYSWRDAEFKAASMQCPAADVAVEAASDNGAKVVTRR